MPNLLLPLLAAALTLVSGRLPDRGIVLPRPVGIISKPILPDTAHNVGVAEVLSPRGAVDSGQQVIPSVVVANYGMNSESLWVKMLIDQSGVPQYRDSLTISTLQPGSYDTVEFTQWIPEGRDSMTTTAWTECITDTFPLNDTARARFLVRVTDLAVTDIIAPVDTLDSGRVVYPRARVWNYGNQTKNFDVRFDIDGSWVSRRNLTLIPGGATLVTAPESYNCQQPGMHIHTVAAIIPDQFPDNNVMVDTFWVRGAARHGPCMPRIIWPIDTIEGPTQGTPTARVINSGSQPETFWTWFSVWDSTCSAIYDESTQVMIGAYDSLDVQFTPDIALEVPGQFVAVCSTYQFNDTLGVVRDTFWVVIGPGVEESPKPQAASSRLTATVVRGVLRIEDRTQNTGYRGELLDATGRRALALKPGANDVSRLPSGVYFVRAASCKLSAVSCQKVVLQR